ncbi:hypothetical protein, partial [Treponema endosymbiont of Eucomonympha sp.]|uniref:hypothetical protein n=1 Tax=Treponema endosymbiont of Eucomonympha sp. TaxID=1580831 RepID=UPI0013968E66
MKYFIKIVFSTLKRWQGIATQSSPLPSSLLFINQVAFLSTLPSAATERVYRAIQPISESLYSVIRVRCSLPGA